jgi:uncharacterized protein
MKPCLVDVNVMLALLVRQHEHHSRAREWYDGLQTGQAALCRLVQLAVIRLLGTAAVMGTGHTVSAAQAWSILAELLGDERIDFAPEPAALDHVLPRFWQYPAATPKLVTDAYLAAFAISGRRTLVTLDQGFRQFQGLEVEVLN